MVGSSAQAKLNNKVVRFVDKRNAREMRLFTTVSTEHVADVLSQMHGLRHRDTAGQRAGAGGASVGRVGAPAPAHDDAVVFAQEQVEAAERVLYQYFSDIKSIFRFYRCVPEARRARWVCVTRVPPRPMVQYRGVRVRYHYSGWVVEADQGLPAEGQDLRKHQCLGRHLQLRR